LDQSVGRALKVLEAVVKAGAPLRLAAIAEAVDLKKSTVHRLLKTLMALGYVEQEAETGRYGASLKLWEMGSAVVVEHPVRRAAGSFLQSLHKETGETVSLLVPDGDDVIYLDKLVSPRAVRFSTRPGSRTPAPLTSGGRAMLAHHPEARQIVERVAAKVKGRRGYEVDKIMVELEQTRARGYAISRDNPGVVSLGCALMAKTGLAAAALSISAPTERLADAGAEARLVEALMSTCARLTELVGYL
jgi:DNA-binding IclR family transcriptional regulator